MTIRRLFGDGFVTSAKPSAQKNPPWESPAGLQKCRKCLKRIEFSLAHAPEKTMKGKSMSSVKKAVFPVAGLGTRFLPATKASPKEMLPIVDKPLIQYAVEEAAAAGITDMIFVTGRSKRAI
jgi:hypothetical protein